jgi:hypothetical protein
MVTKKVWLIASILLVLIVVGIIYIRGPDDSWIKDKAGVWVMHGNPVFTPPEVKEQQDALACASELYAEANFKKLNLSSQCLGTCGSYSIDLVHVPRISEDDQVENQCKDFIDKKTIHFIEINSRGNVVRIL